MAEVQPERPINLRLSMTDPEPNPDQTGKLLIASGVTEIISIALISGGTAMISGGTYYENYELSAGGALVVLAGGILNIYSIGTLIKAGAQYNKHHPAH